MTVLISVYITLNKLAPKYIKELLQERDSLKESLAIIYVSVFSSLIPVPLQVYYWPRLFEAWRKLSNG